MLAQKRHAHQRHHTGSILISAVVTTNERSCMADSMRPRIEDSALPAIHASAVGLSDGMRRR